jgi:hypothetical protein
LYLELEARSDAVNPGLPGSLNAIHAVHAELEELRNEMLNTEGLQGDPRLHALDARVFAAVTAKTLQCLLSAMRQEI